MQLIPTIGLEIHAELKTKTKMFCGCLNDSDEKHPNINICPICMGHPGALPVINQEAVKNVLKVGLALNGKIADYSRFDRKNYFYPDLPKGYQISQYQYPLVSGGEMNGIKITRIHLEEDTGRLSHKKDESLVDFNRAGVPLMELVTEPDITSGKEARKFCEELQLFFRYLDVSNADMEKGEMRCEVNISLNMGTKAEIKNLNSFRVVEKAIDYEIKRQSEALEKGGKIQQETRGWDDVKQITFSQRSKEEAHDYRYFPEPDLPPLLIFSQEKIAQRGAFAEASPEAERRRIAFNLDEIILPELPPQKRERFKKEYSFKENQIEILVRDKNLSDFLEQTISEIRELKDVEYPSGFSGVTDLVFNYLSSDLVGLMREQDCDWSDLRVTPHSFAELITMIFDKKISSRSAKEILKIMLKTGSEPAAIVEEKDLTQTSDAGFMEDVVKKIIASNLKAVNDYKNGKNESLQFLVGQVMRETKGKINPEELKKILIDYLSEK